MENFLSNQRFLISVRFVLSKIKYSSIELDKTLRYLFQYKEQRSSKDIPSRTYETKCSFHSRQKGSEVEFEEVILLSTSKQRIKKIKEEHRTLRKLEKKHSNKVNELISTIRFLTLHCVTSPNQTSMG